MSPTRRSKPKLVEPSSQHALSHPDKGPVLDQLSLDRRIELSFELKRYSDQWLMRAAILGLLILAVRLLDARLDSTAFLILQLSDEKLGIVLGTLAWGMIFFYANGIHYGYASALIYSPFGITLPKAEAKTFNDISYTIVVALPMALTLLALHSAVFITLFLTWGDLWSVVGLAVQAMSPE